jgi:hypothetical protein
MAPGVYFYKFLVRLFIFRKSRQNKYKNSKPTVSNLISNDVPACLGDLAGPKQQEREWLLDHFGPWASISGWFDGLVVIALSELN